MVKESEFGGELCKNANKERLAAKAKEGTGPRFYIPAGAKSQGWDFLALDASAKFRLVCLLGKGCELDYTRTEGRPASADKDTNHSTFLARHASKCHKKPEQRETKRVWGSGKPPLAAFVHTGKEALAAAAAAAAPAAGTAAGAGQGRLTADRLFRPRTDADLRRLDRGLAAMLALANLPDALADNKHFMWFCGELTDGQWTPSSRRTVGRHMVDMGNNVIMGLQNLFKRNGPKTYYALQCDIWSSRAGDSYMGHLLTYADADFKTYQIATGCDFMPGSHDMVGVDKVLTKTLHDLYSVPKDQMMAAVHGWSCIDLTDGDDEDERAALEDDGLVDLPDSVLDLLASTSSVGAAGAAGTAGAAGEPGEKAAANAQAMEDMRRVVSDQFERFQTKECAFQALKKVHKANNRNTSVRWNNPVTTRTKEWEAAGGWKLSQAMDWWYRNQHNYPDVALLARAVLSIPANSAGAERMFNGTGQTVNPYRSKLTPDNVRVRTLVRENFFPGLLDTKNYSANQSFVGKRRREEGGAGEGAGGGKEGNGVDGSDGVLDFLPPVAPRCP